MPAVLLAAGRLEVLVGHADVLALRDLVALDDLVGRHGLVVDLAHLDVADPAAVGLVQLVEAQILLAMAVYMRTGAFTRPKEMAPVQTARGRFDAGMVCKDTPNAGISL